MPEAEEGDLVERRLAIAARLLPIDRHDTPDYAEVTGDSFQAMTVDPEAFEALIALPEAIAELTRLRATLLRAEAWKREALEVEREWNPQAIAKLLELSPGDSIRAAIGPAIERLTTERDEAVKALEPFKLEASKWAEMWADDFVPTVGTAAACGYCGEDADEAFELGRFTVGDLRRAASVHARLSRTIANG